MKPKRKESMLGDMLVSQGIISPDQLNQALAKQRQSGLRLGQILVDMNFITNERLTEILSEQSGIPHVWLRTGLIDPKIVNIVPKEKAMLYQVIPMFKVRNELTLAMTDPYAVYVIEDIEKTTNCKVLPVLCRVSDIQNFIEEYYSDNVSKEHFLDSLEEIDVQVVEEGDDKEKEELRELAEGSPVINLVNLIIMNAIRDGASDIHIEPDIDKFRVRYRIDGIMHEVMSSKKEILPAIISRVKVMAKLDIAERRLPQEGRIHILSDGKDVDLRVSSMPTISGEAIVMRILDKNSIEFNLDKLGFPLEVGTAFKNMLKRSNGLILVTGPTGSGKTTTLYAAINHLLTLEKNFITIEDPVEFQFEIVNQIQVNEKIGLTFAKILKSVLRLDPDIIMVGEIRDRETAEVAIQAALTGHLVISTLHTNDSCGAITRLLEMDIEPYLVASAVIGSVAQRLVRKVCPSCKTTYIPSKALLDRIGWDNTEHATLVKGKGCPECFDSGFKGRIGIYELFEVSEEARALIARNPTIDELIALRKKSGFKSLREEGLRLIRERITSLEEVTRVIYAEEDETVLKRAS
ncbi:MAG: type II secretion system protein GspE [Candidatus Schekmanbacteria bacterium]|nr:MAG: type II secretion system protein GspE [Candidatus Schekmanbacteria bacterium]